MKGDFNFFNPYEKKEKASASIVITIVRIIALVATVGIVALIIWDIIQIRSLDAAIKKDLEYIESDDTVSQLKAHEVQLKEKDSLTLQENDYKTLGYLVQFNNSANHEAFSLISGIFTEGVRIDNISVNLGKVSMTGVASDLAIIANYELVLKESQLVKNVFVTTVNRNIDLIHSEENIVIEEIVRHGFSIKFDLKEETIFKTGG